jgi:glycosyltransferase domain-containing protein
MKELLTIVIPTHERPLLVARSIAYYASWNCRIIIADSSKEAYKIGKQGNIEYLYCPGEYFSKKVSDALQRAATPFVCLCADDDFLSVDGVTRGLAFLADHDDYVSVQGRYNQFMLSGSEVSCVPLYTKVYGMDLNDEDPAKRIIASARLGMHQLYALHRTKVLQAAFSLCREMRPATLVEYSINLVGMFFGKHILLPIFWMARDAGRYTEYNYSQANATTVVRSTQLRDLLLAEEGIAYKKNFATLFSSVTGRDAEEGKKIFMEAFFDIYLPADKGAERKAKENQEPAESPTHSNSTGFTLRGLIKSILSPKIIRAVKAITPSAILGWRTKQAYPFPFREEPVFERDWRSMEKIVKKHGMLPTVTHQVTS